MNEIQNVIKSICSRVEQMENRMCELCVLYAIELSLTPGDSMNE